MQFQNKVNSSFMNYYSLAATRFLIIDDDEGLCQSIKFFFEDHESEVHTCHDGETGIKMFDEVRPDIVLVDINMPGMSGHSVVAHISRKSPETPVIVVSGTGVIKDVIRSMNLGAWDFVTKPILNFEDLEMSVLRVLEKSFLIKENKEYKKNLERAVELRTEELNRKSETLEKLVEEYKIAKEQAEAADKMKGEFLAQMSHEIRTPLNAIVSYANFLRGNVGENQEALNSINIINKASDRLIRTIELTLNMAELNSGAYVLDLKKVNINEVLEDSIYYYKQKAEEKGIQLKYISENEDVEIITDHYCLSQIVKNIIDNAVKFTEKGEVRITLNNFDQQKTLEVVDSGVGMSEEFLRNPFQLFTQEKQGYTRPYDGNGLGLALTKRYCDLNGIKLGITSNIGGGTKVKLTFDK